MRKYLMSLFLVMVVTLGAYATALDHGATREQALLVAAAAAVVAVAVAFAFATAATVATVAFAFVAVDDLKVKVRWVLLANLMTIGLIVLGLSSMNPVYIFGFMMAGGLALRWVGDMPKAELATARKEEEKV